MDAIIMCAGLGTRLLPFTATTPKPLIPIAGKSSLERTLEALPGNVDRIILVAGYLADQIREKIGKVAHERPVTYVHQETLDGTGGALRRAKRQITSDRFLVLNGDDLYAADDLAWLGRVERGVLVLKMVLAKDEDAWVVDLANRLVGITRIPAGQIGQVNVGAYCLDHTWFTTQPTLVPGKENEWSLPHAIPELLSRGLTVSAVQASWWLPVGTHEELAHADQLLHASAHRV